MNNATPPAHPGVILLEKAMKPLGVSRNKLARDIDVPVGRISDIVSGKRGISPDTALRLAKYFGTSAEMWMRLQWEYDLYVARVTVWPRIDPRVRVFEPTEEGLTVAGGDGERALDPILPDLPDPVLPGSGGRARGAAPEPAEPVAEETPAEPEEAAPAPAWNEPEPAAPVRETAPPTEPSYAAPPGPTAWTPEVVEPLPEAPVEEAEIPAPAMFAAVEDAEGYGRQPDEAEPQMNGLSASLELTRSIEPSPESSATEPPEAEEATSWRADPADSAPAEVMVSPLAGASAEAIAEAPRHTDGVAGSSPMGGDADAHAEPPPLTLVDEVGPPLLEEVDDDEPLLLTEELPSLDIPDPDEARYRVRRGVD